jgi:hypothetical protein
LSSSLLERNPNGKVRFFGENLKATYDFAKKAARVAHENVSSPEHEYRSGARDGPPRRLVVNDGAV